MARAMSSFPVPVSPRMRTVASLGATVSTCARTCFSAGLSPMTSAKFWVDWISLSRLSFSRRNLSESLEISR